MNTLRAVFSRLEKPKKEVQLSAISDYEELRLEAFDKARDVEAFLSNVDQLGQDAWEAIDALKMEYEALEQADQEFSEVRNKLADVMGEIETKAGELGFAPSDLMPDYQESVDLSLLTFPFEFSTRTDDMINITERGY
jgi:hypothetical protein